MDKKVKNGLAPLFLLDDGEPVYYKDVLWHPDKLRVGWYCIAEFEPIGEYVTVRSDNGAVPTVLISELRKEPPEEHKRCSKCGQLLPKENH